ncbi:hypothetical protein [Streptomyces sp. NRRL F-5135]|uniref:hypothetical protein n=1 Tax=Streptomyces sp. NRRL F-5135 TaxID=1463858 RepID=UPI0004C973DD|nr:hypothetical protein [Streptomyces sp. NRRL F-5135]
MSDDQQYPYGRYGDPDPYGQRHDAQGQGRQGQPPGQAQPQGQFGAPRGWAEPDQAAGGQDQGSAQTWEGQTWDTQYQPHVGWQANAPAQQQQQQLQSQPQAQAPAYPNQAPAYPQQAAPSASAASASYASSASAPVSASAAADTAYLPTQNPYARPLPPETPGTAPAGPARTTGSAGASAPEPGAPLGTPGYGTPTTLGSPRLTDAQRARAEGRSPIIPPGIQPAGLTAVLGLLMAGGAALGQYALLVPVVLLQAVTAAGWFRLNGMWPARQGIALAFLGGITADVALLAAGEGNAVAALTGTLGVWVLLTVVLQLRSRAGADERMEGLMATVSSAALTILAAGHLAASPAAVGVGAIAVAAATVARALPLPGAVSLVAALLAAAGAGIAVGGQTALGAGGALLGLGAGVCALTGLRAASYDYPSRFVHMTAGVALPLTAAAPAVYLLGRALI